MSDEAPPSGPPVTRSASAGVFWQPPPLDELLALLPLYQFVGLIGRGGMGAVYKAVQVSLDRIVAIKVLPGELIALRETDFARRFQNEARAMAKLVHPAITAVFDFGETSNGLYYYVMEYVPGVDVAQLLQMEGRLEPLRAVAIIAQVCDALACAHAHGVIHRDIKPANVLITPSGQVKVTDFGLAKVSDPAAGALTNTHLAMGTPDFVAPEALLGKGSVDGRADLYAVGVMLYNMLTGEMPRGLFQMPGERPGSSIDRRFDNVITRAMQTEPRSRYQTALELRHDIEAITLTPQALPLALPSRPSKKGWYLGGVLILAIIAALAVLFDISGPKNKDANAAASFSGLQPMNGWQPLVTDSAKVLLNPGSAHTDGWYRNPSVNKQGTFRDVAVRARVRYPKEGGSAALSLRSSFEPGKFLRAYELQVGPSDTLRLMRAVTGADNHLVAEQSKILGTWPLSKPLAAGDVYDLAFAANGNQLTAWFDGVQVLSKSDDALAEGFIRISSNGTPVEFRDMEWCQLQTSSSKAEPAPLTPSTPNGPWLDGLAEWLANPPKNASELLTAESGGARIKDRKAVFLRKGLNSLDFKDAAIRATVSDATSYSSLYLRMSGVPPAMKNYHAVFYANGFVKVALNGTQPGGLELLNKPPLPGFNPNVKHRFEFEARGEVLTVAIDGRQVGTVANGALKEGQAYFTGDPGALLEKFEYREF